ncbi:zinc finger MYM-type protein 1-like [Arctopsyche grandis]|uniref:zinc finger MYM-type protein 1-like n=1 Tax=Arctopsyche grandis TaxID=121162 RepID=UPI00406D8B41
MSGSGKRCFRESWLTQYTPYSPMLKGAFCIFCVLFPQPVQRGIQGAFITTPCTKYKDFNECARNHTSSAWHRGCQQDAEHFASTIRDPNKDIICQIDNSVKRTIEENTKKLYPIISTILFCGSNDLAIRGKDSTKGNVEQLYAYRIEGGDSILKNHFDTSAGNARYTSHRTQNDLINLSEQALREDIVKAANNAVGLSIIADETADILGTEQLSLGVRFVDTSSEKAMIRQEFLGFFSTLRRVKTWLRFTMSDERPSGLCMLSVHRDKVNCNKKDFMDKIVDMFGSDNRRLQFLFKE